VVGFAPQPLYHWGKSSQYPLNRRLGGPQRWCGCIDEEKNSLPLSGIELQLSIL